MTLDDVIDDIIGPEARAHMAAALAQGGIQPKGTSRAVLEQTICNNLDAIGERLDEAIRLLAGVLSRAEERGVRFPLSTALLFGDALGVIHTAKRIVVFTAKTNIHSAFRQASPTEDEAPAAHN